MFNDENSFRGKASLNDTGKDYKITTDFAMELIFWLARRGGGGGWLCLIFGSDDPTSGGWSQWTWLVSWWRQGTTQGSTPEILSAIAYTSTSIRLPHLCQGCYGQCRYFKWWVDRKVGGWLICVKVWLVLVVGIILFLFWMLNVSQTASYEITPIFLSVRQYVFWILDH